MDEIIRLQKNLPTLRACANWSVNEFANILGVTRQTINNLEKPNSGTKMTKIQYLAIRSLFTYEIETNKNEKLANLMYYLVDHPEKICKEKRDIISQQAKLLSSAVKGGASVTEVNKTWNSLFNMLGIASASFIIGTTAAWLDTLLSKRK